MITLGGRVVDTSGNGVNAATINIYPVGSGVADATTTSGNHPTTGEAGWWQVTGLLGTKVYRVKVTSGTQSKEFYGLSEVQFNRLTIGQEKFVVDSDGNVTVAGTLAVTGALTHAGVAPVESFVNDTNVTASKSGTAVTLGWSGRLSIARGGTDISNYAVGDMLYCETTDTLSKLAGNTSSTKKYLTQTGTGLASAAPLWAAIADADIPNTVVRTSREVNTGTGLTGGGDLSTNRTLSVVDNTSIQKVTVRKNSGANIGSRSRLNFLSGSGITWTIDDQVGSDEIAILLAMDTTSLVPTSRTITAGTGLTGGGDLSTNRTLSVVDNTSTQKIEVKKGGTLIGTRKSINIIEGAFSSITVADNSEQDRVDLTFTGVDPGAAGYVTVQEEGSNVTARNIVNFIGAAITAADDNVNTRTNVTLNASPDSASVVGTGRTISTTTPLSGGGNLTADRTLSISGLATIGTANQIVGTNAGATAWEYKTISGINHRIDVTHSAGGISLTTGDQVPSTLTTLTATSPLETTSGGTLGANTAYAIKGLSSTGTLDQLVASNGASGWKYVNANTLDVDKVDGVHANAFALAATTVTATSPLAGSGTLGSALTLSIAGLTGLGSNGQLLKSTGTGWAYLSQGTGNGLDADLLDGVHAAVFPKLADSNIFTDTQNIRAGVGNSGLEIGRVASSDAPYLKFYSSGDATEDATIAISGGTAGVTNRGTVTISCTTLRHNAATIWTSANDGDSSGLDADLIDGVDLSGLVQTSRTITTTLPLGGTSNLGSNVTLTFGGLNASTCYGPDAGYANALMKVNATRNGYDFIKQGTGNGLDADTLDSQHASAFAVVGRSIDVTSPLSGGGTLAADRTISLAGLTGLGTNGQLVKSTGTGWTYINANLGSGVSNGIDVQYLGGKQFSEVRVPAGVITAFAGSVAPNDWLFCDGSAVSRTTYSALFSVIGTTYGAGDGSSTFNLPDLRERFVAGKGGSTWAVNLNLKGGESTHALTEAETALHTHTVGSTDIAAFASGAGSSHTHTASTGNASADHTHSGTTSNPGDHVHPLRRDASNQLNVAYAVQLRYTSGQVVAIDDTGGEFLRPGGNHTHTITTGGMSATHTHAVTVNAETAHTHQVDVPAHTHTAAAAGSGTAHENKPPFIVLNHIIKT